MERTTPDPQTDNEPVSTSFEDLAGPDLFENTPSEITPDDRNDEADPLESAPVYMQEGARVMGGDEAGMRKPVRMEALGASGHDPTPFWRGSLATAAMAVATLLGAGAIIDLAGRAPWARYIIAAPTFFACIALWWGVRGILTSDTQGGRLMSIVGVAIGAIVVIWSAAGVASLF